MIWWLKVRRAHLILPAALLLYTVLLVMLHDYSFKMPTILAGTVQARMTLFVPLVTVLGLALCLESRLAAPEASGTRLISRLDVTMSFSFIFAASLLGLLVSDLTGSPEVSAAGRNSAFLAGLLLLAWPVCREAAGLIPAFWIFVVMLAGFRSPRDAYPWAVIPEPPGRPYALIGALLVFLLGITVQARVTQKDSL